MTMLEKMRNEISLLVMPEEWIEIIKKGDAEIAELKDTIKIGKQQLDRANKIIEQKANRIHELEYDNPGNLPTYVKEFGMTFYLEKFEINPYCGNLNKLLTAKYIKVEPIVDSINFPEPEKTIVEKIDAFGKMLSEIKEMLKPVPGKRGPK